MATLTSTKIKNTYDALLKSIDNDAIGTTAKQITDGLGNLTPLYISTTQVGIGVTPESGLNLHVYGDAKIGSNLTVIGNLVVEGSTTTVGTDTLTVKDPLIVLANNNTSTDAVDIGFYGKYTPSGTTLYSGLFREALTGKYRLFKDLQVEPTTTVNTSGTGYAQATLIAALEGNVTGNVTGNLTGNVTGGTISGTTGTFSGDVEVNGGDLSITSSTGLASVELGGASGGYIDIKAPESDDYDMRFIVSQGGNEITTASGDLKINTANTLALTIDSSQDATFAGGVSATTGTFSGDVNVNSNLIVTTGTPISGSANGSNVIAKIDSSAGTDSGGLEIHTGDINGDEAALLHTNYNGDEAFRITSLGHIVSTGSASFVGQVTIPETPTADTHAASKGYVDSAVEGQDTLAEILAIGNTTGGTDIAITAGDKITNFTSTGIDDNAASTAITIDSSQDVTFASDISFADENKILLGDGDDVEMYWSSNGAFVIDVAPLQQGMLIVSNTLRASSGTHTYIDFNQAELEFFSLGNEKFKVHQTGVTVTGVASITGNTTIGGDLAVDTDTLFVDVSEDSVGIGLTNPSDYSADELVISVPDDSGMTLVSGTTDTAYIRFANGTAAADQANFISHDHDTNTLTVFSQAKVSIGILEAEVAYFTDTVFYVDKSTTIDDTLTIQDDFKAGDLGDPYLLLADVSAATVYVEGELDVNGKIAIDTNIPKGKLDITGNSGLISSSLGQANLSSINLRVTNTVNRQGQIVWSSDTPSFTFGLGAIGMVMTTAGTGTNTGTADMIFSTKSGTSDAASTERMRIDSSGNVGIGTDDPNQLLEISKNGSPVMRLNSSKTTSGAAGDSIGRIEWRGSSTAGNGAGIKAAIDTSATTTTQRDFNLLFKTSTNVGSGEPETRMQINADGNVGIGTDSPDRKLHVNSGSTNEVAKFESTDSTAYLSIVDNSTTYSLQGIGSVGNNLTFYSNNAERMRIDSDGNVNIVGTNSGASNTSMKLIFDNTDVTVQANQLAGGIEWHSDDSSGAGAGIKNSINSFFTGTGGYAEMRFSTSGTDGNNTERMRIDSSGNVGIGETNPENDNRLHIKYSDANITPLSSSPLVVERNDVCLIQTLTSNASDAGILFGDGDDNDIGGLFYLHGSDAMTFRTNTSEKMRINSSGDVGIGTSTLLNTSAARTVVTIGNSSSNFLNFSNAGSTRFGGIYSDATQLVLLSDTYLKFETGSPVTERMRITSGGDVLIGTQGTPNGTSVYGSAFTDETSNRMILRMASSTTGAVNLVQFSNGNGLVGKIQTSGSATSYITSSDYRLKENIVEMTGALDRVSQLKPSRFNFIADADKTVDGFLAHEVQEIVPEAISGEKDGMRDEEYEVSPDVYEDVVHPAEEAVYETIEHPAVEEELDDEGNVIVEGKEAYTEEVLVTEAKEEWTEKVLVSEKVMGTREVPDYQGIDQSKLVPLLVGAIQEQQQLINDLKSRIETLENN
jgi:hypothetical protein